ncbi:senescence/dehydration-associated protein At4g35985, chloroplastic-like [Quercus robur]|uniref:Senescence domain-containing protein n=1 Tax=Quercus lobata TaxID=97700 RepID=A0A7N2KW12_QUELO|nr:senescence/dehydration-associated protein At4g35985, chloroplastic-like [Quercus lobata]XP_030952367.1 senescence/dehydration-associated protein At4g35985, chloroplastic-like [Quercus lobata]XP_050269508.1 senescence/dehydration-associated protein At4g35985, chloroplastic-like [Quercus robur]
MGCFSFCNSKTPSPMQTSFSEAMQENPEPRYLKQEVLLRIPGSKVHLMDEGEAVELSSGEFMIVKISDENVSLATIIKVGEDLQWPLTKDEPVVKVDAFHYLFSLPMKDGDPLSYGVTFFEQSGSNLGFLDSFLKEHTCFSGSEYARNKNVDWKEFAPRMDDYNNVLAKAIAGGTGQIVRGMFKCSNAYTNQVQKGGEMIITTAVEEKNGVKLRSNSNRSAGATKKSGVNKSLKRVRKLSKMTEKLSKSMLDGIGFATGSVMKPVVKSQAGKAFLKMMPGEVLLASLDAVNKILDAAEVAEIQALSATSRATTRMVTKRFGESAGEATEDVLATAGHCAGTAWNIFKIRKAINPASSVSTGVLKNAAKDSKGKS